MIRITNSVSYTSVGVFFGTLFPAFATILDMVVRDLPIALGSFLLVQQTQPLHWIIDTAPVFLGLFACLAGRRQDRIESTARDLESKKALLADAKRDLEQRVDELRVMQNNLQETRDAAEAASRAKSVFVANISHEIRTPMNSILGFTEILDGLITDAAQKQYLQYIKSGSRTLLALINNILDLSKVEAGKLELAYGPVGLQELTEAIRGIFVQKAADEGLELRIEIDPDLPGAVVLDEVGLRQILVNLVGNAVKFTDSGHVKLSVRTQAGTNNAGMLGLMFEVEDTGIGIPEEQQEAIFGAFEQQTGQSQAKYGGTGLGLAITKRLVELMGGRISVDSEVGRGSTFQVLLKDVEVAAVSDLEAAEPDAVVPDRMHFDPATILVVDNVAIDRRAIQGYLEPYGFTLLEAEDGQEALEMMRKHRPDLVLMDIRMPVQDGFTATQMARADSEIGNIPIVTLSASGLKEIEKEGVSDGFLWKPVARHDLVAQLARFLAYTTDEGTAAEASQPEPEGEPAAGTLTLELVEKLLELVDKLDERQEAWERLRDAPILDDVEAFVADMLELGRDYGYLPLEAWGEKLGEQAEAFDIRSLSRTLEAYPEIIEQARSIGDKSNTL